MNPNNYNRENECFNIINLTTSEISVIGGGLGFVSFMSITMAVILLSLYINTPESKLEDNQLQSSGYTNLVLGFGTVGCFLVGISIGAIFRDRVNQD